MSEGYPKYRELSNGAALYVLESADRFTEYQLVGSKAYEVHTIQVKTLPERNLFMDLLNNEGERWHLLTAEEFNHKLALLEKDRRRIGGHQQ